MDFQRLTLTVLVLFVLFATSTDAWWRRRSQRRGDGWLRRTWDNTKEKAENTWDSAKDKASDVWDNVKDKTENAWDKVKDKAEDAWDNVKEKAEKIGKRDANLRTSDEYYEAAQIRTGGSDGAVLTRNVREKFEDWNAADNEGDQEADEWEGNRK